MKKEEKLEYRRNKQSRPTEGAILSGKPCQSSILL